jgi:hypothetical protein
MLLALLLYCVPLIQTCFIVRSFPQTLRLLLLIVLLVNSKVTYLGAKTIIWDQGFQVVDVNVYLFD